MTENKERINDYFDYSVYEKYKLREMILKNKIDIGEKNKLTKELGDLKKQWEKIKKRYIRRNKKGKEYLPRKWSGYDAMEISKKVGLLKQYLIIFGFLCKFVHPSSTTTSAYMPGRDKDGMVVYVGTHIDYIDEVLLSAKSIFIDFINLVNKEYQTNNDILLEKLILKFKNATPHSSK